jgi:peptide/nickel transport system permease protein
MFSYIIRRLLLMIPALFIVSLLVFFLVRFVPGDVVDAMASRATISGGLDRATIEKVLGLDQPVLIQYGRWMGFLPQASGEFSGVIQGDLGDSMWSGSSVKLIVSSRLPVSLELGFLGIILALVIAIPIGVISAVRQDSLPDYLSRSFAMILISVPNFWIGTLVIVFPAIWWDYMGPIRYFPFLTNPLENVRMIIVPALILGMTMSGIIMRMTRTMLLEVLRQDYIRTAWAKGLKERIIIIRHALKNAFIPIVSIVGRLIPVLIGGAVVIEVLFSLPGMGRLLYDAITSRDYTLVTGIVLIMGVGVMFVNLLVDLTYAYLDPRIRYN